jgi:peptidoglycan/LPS O-acetylase OafA/YrhL
MALGNGIEVASMTAGGGEVALGHALFLIGFLVSVIGSLLVGIVVFRRRRDALSRAAALLLALALPLGIGIAVLGSAIAPESDAGFWAAISVPTGIAWVLLGRSLSARRPAQVGEFVPA